MLIIRGVGGSFNNLFKRCVVVSEKLQVAWDFDGVFVRDRCMLFIEWLQNHCRWNVDLSIFRRTGNFPMATGRPKLDIDIHYAKFVSEGHAPQCVSIECAQFVLGPLTKICNHHVVTSRDGDALTEAMDIACSWGVPIESFHGGRFGQKVPAMRQYNLLVLIDNSPHEAIRFQEQVGAEDALWMIQFPDIYLLAPRIDHPRIIRTAACDEAHELVQAGVEITSEKTHELLESAWVESRGLLEQFHGQFCV